MLIGLLIRAQTLLQGSPEVTVVLPPVDVLRCRAAASLEKLKSGTAVSLCPYLLVYKEVLEHPVSRDLLSL